MIYSLLLATTSKVLLCLRFVNTRTLSTSMSPLPVSLPLNLRIFLTILSLWPWSISSP